MMSPNPKRFMLLLMLLRRHLAMPALLLLIVIGFFWKLTLTGQFSWLENPDAA